MKASRLVNALFVVLFLATGVFSVAFLYRDYQHLDNLRSENAVLSRQQENLQRESAAREAQLEKLKGDSEYIESLIRTKLNYAKEGETVFRFEQ